MGEPAASLWIRAGRAKERKKRYVADWLIGFGFGWWLSRHPHPGSHGAGEGEVKRLANGLVEGCWSGWLRGRGGGRSSYDHAQHREGGRSPPPSSHLPGGGQHTRPVTYINTTPLAAPPLPLPRLSNRSRWPILLLRRVA